MYKILQFMFVFVLVFGVYYAIDKYNTKQFMDGLREMDLVSSNSLDKLSITMYPELESYLSFDNTEIQNTYQALTKLDLQEAKPGKAIGKYMRIRFTNESMQSYVEYNLFDDGYLSRAENGISVYTSFYYKTDPAELNALVEELLTGKTFD